MFWLKRRRMLASMTSRRLSCEPLEDRITPDARPLPIPVYYFGAGFGSPPMVRAYQA